MERNVKYIWAFVFLVLWSSSAFAYQQSFYGETCNGCTSAQYKNAAILQGVGERYVADFQSGTLKKFLVSKEPGFNGTFTYIANALTVEPDHFDAFLRLKAIWDSNSHSLSYVHEIEAAGSISQLNAFDVVDPGIGRNAVTNYLSNWNNWSLGNIILFNFQSYANAFLAFRTGTPVSITIVVYFSDGSHSDFTFSYSNNTWKYEDKSSVDSHGNPIPQSRNDIIRNPDGTQNYDYRGPGNPSDLLDSLNRFSQFGVPISSGSYWACTNSPAGLHCVHPY